MVELAEQLAAAQEELNIMLDVINQVRGNTALTACHQGPKKWGSPSVVRRQDRCPNVSCVCER